MGKAGDNEPPTMVNRRVVRSIFLNIHMGLRHCGRIAVKQGVAPRHASRRNQMLLNKYLELSPVAVK
jgi:hypothetical protein